MELEQIKSAYENEQLEVNGNVYKFLDFNHKNRRVVFSYFSKNQESILKGQFDLDNDNFENVEKIICDKVTCNDTIVSKANYWDKHPEDYLMFITQAIMVVCYPFLQGVLTN